MERKSLMLIDFNNVFHSHYHSRHLTNSKGKNVQGIVGFIFRMRNLREIFNPDYIVLTRDVSRIKTFRKELYKDYKGNRSKTDDDFIFQSSEALRLFALMGYPIIGNERYEADDIMGMCSALADDLGMDTTIVSADRDLYQLISPHTKIWSFRNDEIIDLKYMSEVYGMTPSQWIEMKVLQGDQSDNIPGIQGIGKKTSQELIRAFGNVAGVYNNMQKLSDKLQQRLREGKTNIPLMRTLVTILRDYRILGITDKNFERNEIFDDEVYNMIYELEIPSVLNSIQYDLLPIVRNNFDNFVMSN